MMKRLHVNIPGREYDIAVGSGILESAGELVRGVYGGKRAAVVTDSNVGPLYAKTIAESLCASGIEPHIFTVPAGEASKCSARLEQLYTDMLGMNITRGELVVALGGGVVGDLAGYAACTLLRGIPIVQIPTTLLSQVDSSVGGKVAINHPLGKNLIGAFHQPRLVIADTRCLYTLDARVFADGMGEVIKHGAIADRDLFGLLRRAGGADGLSGMMEEIIYRNCGIKRSFVERDETEAGPRMALNFGHTFGHAVEKHYNFEKYTHGEAVAIGMAMACALGEKLGITKPGTAGEMEELLRMYNLPVRAGLEPAALIDGMLRDKKRDGDTVRFVLLKDIGSWVIHPLEATRLGEALA